MTKNFHIDKLFYLLIIIKNKCNIDIFTIKKNLKYFFCGGIDIRQINNGNNLRNIILFLFLVIIGSIVLSGAVSATSLATSAQPKIHHDNNNTGQSQYKGPNTNSTKWKYTTGNKVESSPTIGSDGTIYFGSQDHNLYALNPNGTLKWNYTAGGNIDSSATIGDDGTIYFGSDDHKLYALKPDGTLKWNYTTGNIIYSSPAIGKDGTIYIGSLDNKLYALNPDGTLKWNYTTGNFILMAPAIGSDGIIYIGSLDNKLYALNPDGTQKWNYTAGNFIFFSPAIGSDGTIYFGSDDHKLYALKPDGTLKWNYTTRDYIDSAPAIGSDGTIYIGTDDSIIYAINPDGTQKWNYTIEGNIHSDITIGSDGSIYFGSNDTCLYALNPNGTLKWNYTTGSYIESTPAIGTDGTIYFGSCDGILYAVSDLTVNANVKGGYYNTSQTVSLTTNNPGIIYYTINGTTPTNSSPVYVNPILISASTLLKYFAIDIDGNPSTITTQTYIMDTLPPTVKTSVNGGLYNTTKIVKLSMNEKGTIYYTLNGKTPTTSSIKYTGPISIKSTTILKYFAVDLAGNKSPIYTATYTIDKIAPKVATTTPVNNAKGVSLTSAITIKFSEKISKSINFSKIYIKNLSTGKIAKSTVTSINGNTITLKMAKSRLRHNNYQVYIPISAVKDAAGNKNTNYLLNFKTSKY